MRIWRIRGAPPTLAYPCRNNGTGGLAVEPQHNLPTEFSAGPSRRKSGGGPARNEIGWHDLSRREKVAIASAIRVGPQHPGQFSRAEPLHPAEAKCRC